MQRGIKQELHKIERKEKKRFSGESKKKPRKTKEWAGKMQEKIPEKLDAAIGTAFYKAFYMIFEKGAKFVEKTFSKEAKELEFRVNDFRIAASSNQKAIRRSIQKMESSVKRGNRRNVCVTMAEGIGLGVFGVGLPDIPLFLGMVMKGLYEIATGYGFSYDGQKERVFLLRIICGALAEGEKKQEADAFVEKWMENIEEGEILDFDAEVKRASDALAHSMLVAKFIQGLPVAGVLGGIANPFIYHKMMYYAEMKYKKRYLLQKIKE